MLPNLVLYFKDSLAVKFKGVLKITKKQMKTKQNRKNLDEPERWTEWAKEEQSHRSRSRKQIHPTAVVGSFPHAPG